jgi:hypothetical protein
MVRSFLGFAGRGDRPVPAPPRVRSPRTGASGPLQGAGTAKASMVGLRTSGAEGPAQDAAWLWRDGGAPIACDLPLKRAVDGSDRSKPEGGPARVGANKNESREDLHS